MPKSRTTTPTLRDQIAERTNLIFLSLNNGGRAVAELYDRSINVNIRVAALRFAARWLRSRGIEDATVLELEAGAAVMQLEEARRGRPAPPPLPDYGDDPDETVIVSVRPRVKTPRSR